MDKKEEELRGKLDDLQYDVTQKEHTEPPFSSALLQEKRDGKFHCVVCDAPLFDSSKKFDSGTGWPSFSDIMDNENVETKEDDSHFMKRTEVHCANCKAHLGHVFDDGPTETGKRYCINGASLNFENKNNGEQQK